MTPSEGGPKKGLFWGPKPPILDPYFRPPIGAKSLQMPSEPLMYSSHNGPQKGPILGVPGAQNDPYFGPPNRAKSLQMPSEPMK